MKTLSFTAPWPPSLNRIWRHFNGRVVLSAEGRAYAGALVNCLPMGRIEPMTGRIVLWAWFHPPASYGLRKWDVANREKIFCDALTKAKVWLDDSQIDELHLARADSTDKGSVDILIQEY